MFVWMPSLYNQSSIYSQLDTLSERDNCRLEIHCVL